MKSEKTEDEMKREVAIELVELACEENEDVSPDLEQLFDSYFVDPRKVQARKRFLRPAYSGVK